MGDSLAAKGFLHLGKEVALLPALVSHELSVNIVRVFGAPLHECLVRVSDGTELHFSNNAADAGSGLSGDELVGKRCVALTQLRHAPEPGGTVGVRDLDNRVNSASISVCPLSRGDNAWSQSLEFPESDLFPHRTEVGWEDAALGVRAGAGHG